jgi:hypothetical protein
MGGPARPAHIARDGTLTESRSTSGHSSLVSGKLRRSDGAGASSCLIAHCRMARCGRIDVVSRGRGWRERGFGRTESRHLPLRQEKPLPGTFRNRAWGNPSPTWRYETARSLCPAFPGGLALFSADACERAILARDLRTSSRESCRSATISC